jgi:thiol:disulfide interchange protein DsbD
MWAEWCEACKKLDITTFKDPEVMLTLSQDFILLKLDLTELDPQSELIQKKYEIQSLPTLVLLPPSGDLAQKELITGYVEAGTLLNELRRFRLTTTK